MTQEEFNALTTGDIVRIKNRAESWIVTGNYGSHVTVVRTLDATNPPEWDLIFKADHKPPPPNVCPACQQPIL